MQAIAYYSWATTPLNMRLRQKFDTNDTIGDDRFAAVEDFMSRADGGSIPPISTIYPPSLSTMLQCGGFFL